ncbi:putative transglutaminase-like cysteine proteinase [Aureimonas jatrophae]|uniref:Predicted transglutaminase-like cysteine proteinase n=2 Tax=Aureimonas jatrophae TaxID=1166073 RepID=A0A1H0JMR1_9HYPH|nr:transglutaminase-like cysteine peptidase [Aureimonas jatrophae]MBB3951333.1 putative transglutaminase-like cysteine proteinase [Aureimonas jatrophae]SDO44812.1 Predicted transglutaminase-like cysteine proteinase [Aureimonas jatrophae]
MKRLSIAVLIAIVAGFSTANAASVSMTVRGATSQPVGHYDFCKRTPQECTVTERSGPIAVTEKVWETIVEINNAVNVGITPRTDEEIYGVAEYWAYPTTEGDCEDFALLKQYMLEREGFPRSAMVLTVVRQQNGDGHAVLTLRTDRGDLILDNLDRRVLDWTQTTYHYLKRQSETDASRWVSIDDDRDLLVGSVQR